MPASGSHFLLQFMRPALFLPRLITTSTTTVLSEGELRMASRCKSGSLNISEVHISCNVPCIFTDVREPCVGNYNRTRRLFKKIVKRWSVYITTSGNKQNILYIPALQSRILRKRILSDAGLPRTRPCRPEDPRRLGLLPDIPPPPMDELLQTQTRRGQGS